MHVKKNNYKMKEKQWVWAILGPKPSLPNNWATAAIGPFTHFWVYLKLMDFDQFSMYISCIYFRISVYISFFHLYITLATCIPNLGLVFLTFSKLVCQFFILYTSVYCCIHHIYSHFFKAWNRSLTPVHRFPLPADSMKEFWAFMTRLKMQGEEFMVNSSGIHNEEKPNREKKKKEMN